MNQVDLAVQLPAGTLITTHSRGGNVYRVVGHNPTLGKLEIVSVCTGERQLLNRYSGISFYMCAVQPQWHSTLTGGHGIIQSTLDKVQPISIPIATFSELRAKDPSRGEATHYSVKNIGQRYHRVFEDGSVSFWVCREGLPGYWEAYPHQGIGQRALINAIVLQEVYAQYSPTQEDYAKAREITQAKHNARTKKIQRAIKTLQKAQEDLNRQYTRKLNRVDKLHKAAR